MKTYVLERTQIINQSRAETFSFFCDAFNLEQITPPFLRFRVVTPRPISMATGALIDYRLSLFGVPLKWKTRIEEWSPEEKFVDRQLRVPYSLWHHTHTFESLNAHQSLMTDRVEYRLPLGILGTIAHALQVRRTLDRIFDYRAEVIERLLNQDHAPTVRVHDPAQRQAFG